MGISVGQDREAREAGRVGSARRKQWSRASDDIEYFANGTWVKPANAAQRRRSASRAWSANSAVLTSGRGLTRTATGASMASPARSGLVPSTRPGCPTRLRLRLAKSSWPGVGEEQLARRTGRLRAGRHPPGRGARAGSREPAERRRQQNDLQRVIAGSPERRAGHWRCRRPLARRRGGHRRLPLHRLDRRTQPR